MPEVVLEQDASGGQDIRWKRDLERVPCEVPLRGTRQVALGCQSACRIGANRTLCVCCILQQQSRAFARQQCWGRVYEMNL